jgi:hypothetical protein
VVFVFFKDLQGLDLMIGDEVAADDGPLSPTDPAPQPNLLMDNVFDNPLPSSICNQQWEAGILFQLRHKFFLPFEALELVSDAIHEGYERCASTIQVLQYII